MGRLRIISIAILAVFCICCNNPAENVKAITTADPLSGSHCYRYTGNRDTIFLKINYLPDSITGELIYQLYEKDKNTGTINGQLKGDLLIADYSFMSEGIVSVRQVAFKRSGSGWVEGYKASPGKNAKLMFADTNALKFGESMVLRETSCEK